MTNASSPATATVLARPGKQDIHRGGLRVGVARDAEQAGVQARGREVLNADRRSLCQTIPSMPPMILDAQVCESTS
jgi:hypothetical protein